MHLQLGFLLINLCVDPKFDECFTFLVDDPSLELRIDLFDQDLLYSDFMGRLKIPLENQTREPQQKWYPLTDQGGFNGGSLGEIQVSTQWLGNVRPRPFLKVGLMQASGLRATQFEGRTSCNPYAVMICDGVKHVSTTQRHTVNPIWDEQFSWKLEDGMPSLSLRMIVYDHHTAAKARPLYD
jgi:Ca2+-dependent lipid-binding protein